MLIRLFAVVASLSQPIRAGAHFSTTGSTTTVFGSITGTSDDLQPSSSLPSAESPISNVWDKSMPSTSSTWPNVTAHGFKHGSGCHANCTFTKVESNFGQWTRCQTKATNVVGKVVLIVDDSTNITTTSTSYLDQVTFTSNGTLVTSDVSDILANGSQILTRADVNAAGTVTVAVDGKIVPYPTTHHSISESYGFVGRLPYATNGTTKCITGLHNEETPLPSIPPITTDTTTADSADPQGWTYCYDGGFYEPIVDPEWYSHFSDSIVGILSNESVCKQAQAAWAPVQAVAQVPFLLETTTSFAAGSKESLQNEVPTSTHEQSIQPVTLDPFQFSITSDVAQGSTSTSTSSPATSSQPKTTQNVESQHSVSQDQSSALNEGLQRSGDAEQGHESTRDSLSTPDVTRSSLFNDESPDNTAHSEQLTRHSTKSPLETTSTIIKPSNVLISLIDIVAQSDPDTSRKSLEDATSTSGKQADSHTSAANGDPEDKTGDQPADQVSTVQGPSHRTGQSHHGDPMSATLPTATEGGSHTSHQHHGTSHTLSGSPSSPGPSTLDIGEAAPSSASEGKMSTLISNSEFLVAGQTLKPGGPAITTSGTTVSLATNATAFVIDPSTSSLTESLGIGSYIWAGIAGSIPGATDRKASTSSLAENSPDAKTGDPDTSSQNYHHQSGTTSTIIDGSNGKSSIGSASETGSVESSQDAMKSSLTATSSTTAIAEAHHTSSEAMNGVASKSKPDASSTSNSGAAITSFGRRSTESSVLNAFGTVVLSSIMFALWLLRPS